MSHTLFFTSHDQITLDEVERSRPNAPDIVA